MSRPSRTVASGPQSALPLMLHGGVALLGLWTFYTLLCWGCIAALPQQEGALDPTAVAAVSALGGAAIVLLTALASPWLLDRLLRVTWIKLEEAGDVGPYLRSVLEQLRLPPPYLGVIADPDPCALTYGLMRRSARLLVTKGLLESLDLDEQCAVITHEAAHLASGDFRLATVFAGPMLVMAQIRRLFEMGGAAATWDAADGAAPTPYGQGGFLTPLLGVLLRVYALLYAGFAQVRERWADQFAGRRLDARALENGLLVMLTRLAAPSPSRHALAVAARGFTPVDAVHAGRLGTAAAWDGALDAARLAELARVVEANPASALTQQVALHPPIGGRIPQGGGATAAVRKRSLMRLFSAGLPAFGFVAGLGISLSRGDSFGLPLVLWGLGRLVWLGLAHGRTHGEVANEAALRDVMEKFAAEPARAFRATLAGEIVGYGIPGQTWCPDLVLEVGSVFIAVRPCTAVGALRAEVERRILQPIERQSCAVRGVLRMVDVPYLELHAVDVDGHALWRSHFILRHGLVSVALVLLGLLLNAPQWLGL